ncbi:gp18.3 [Paenibacillus mucilaginosus 3016]|uniref:Gp18.3 n=1 Tax=Paenibacillus mucilaginosus 3016 TaxID=1116391 RepID=H6NE14_9BACL|nr:glycoside hydrolase family 55 protein [Paenibacillus mucilaginosus]AFC32967.1 gp18.3 [Paenibacillus mucilaginosus 3016]
MKNDNQKLTRRAILSMIGLGGLSLATSKWLAPVPAAASAAVEDDVYNVMKYGAAGNGTTNDQPAIQKAIEACKKAGGGTVYLPAGTYLISSRLFVGSNTVLKGNAKLVKPDNSEVGMISIDGSNVSVEELWLENLNQNAGYNINLARNAKHIEIRSCKFTGVKTQAIDMNAKGIKHILIQDCIFEAVTYGVLTNYNADDLEDLKIIGNRFIDIYGDAIEINSPISGTKKSAYEAASNIIISNNFISVPVGKGTGDTAGFGIGLAGASRVSVMLPLCRVIRTKLLLAVPVLPHDNHRHPDAGNPRESVLDFARLDPVAADFDLIVGPAQEFDAPVRQPAGAVACTVQPHAGEVGMLREFFRRKLRLVEIAPREPRSGQVQFACRSDRLQLPVLIQDADRHTADRPSQGHTFTRQAAAHKHVHRGFRRPVMVVELVAFGQQCILQSLLEPLPSADQCLQRFDTLHVREQFAHQHRGRIKQLDAMPADIITEHRTVQHRFLADDVQPGSVQQRAEDLLEARVKGVFGGQHDGRGQIRLVGVMEPGDRIQDAPVLDLYALRCSRRAGGVEKVSEIAGSACRVRARGCRGASSGAVQQNRVQCGRHPVLQTLLNDYGFRPCILQHIADALRRQLRSDRDVGRTGFEDPQDAGVIAAPPGVLYRDGWAGSCGRIILKAPGAKPSKPALLFHMAE